MHLHCRFYFETDSDSHLHCRFYLKTSSDSNFHYRFYLKTGSDVHAPYIKQTAGHIHRSHPPTNSLSLISHISLSLLKTSTLALCDLVMAPVFFNGIDMLSSPIFYLYSFDLYLYSCFFAFYIYIYSYSLHSIYI
jgi:hypothetical protein